jgi:hypothetical protein
MTYLFGPECWITLGKLHLCKNKTKLFSLWGTIKTILRGRLEQYKAFFETLLLCQAQTPRVHAHSPVRWPVATGPEFLGPHSPGCFLASVLSQDIQLQHKAGPPGMWTGCFESNCINTGILWVVLCHPPHSPGCFLASVLSQDIQLQHKAGPPGMWTGCFESNCINTGILWVVLCPKGHTEFACKQP